MTEPLKKLEVIIRPGKFDAVKKAVESVGCSGVTVSQVEGHGNQKGLAKEKHGTAYKMEFVSKLRMEIVTSASHLEPLIEAISQAARTGEAGDGKIFVSNIEEAIRIRTGESGLDAV